MTFQPLIDYALRQKLLAEADAVYCENLLTALYGFDAPAAFCAALSAVAEDAPLGALLDAYTELALQKGIVPEDTVTQRDLFAAKLMGMLTPMPSQINRTFAELYETSPQAATDWFYDICCANGYIQQERIAKNVQWDTPTAYGDLHITINLSKPEKDPRAIAAAAAAKSVSYPACQLCVENVGYAGRLDHPARQNLRIVPYTSAGEQWGLQYSPYAYYPQHCIALSSKHTPMKIDHKCFVQLLDFVKEFPHYFIGSNADLPIVGGSILSHAHFQGGLDCFPMTKAPIVQAVQIAGFADIRCGIVDWPMSVLRITGENPERLAALADVILQAWRGYTDADMKLFAETDGVPHHTITPIARRRGTDYELDLVLRDNHTTAEHPMGVYHPHAELHHIKKENIGLIEVMGLAVLPARLKSELEQLKTLLQTGGDLRADEATAKHADWVEQWLPDYPQITDYDAVLRDEVGKVFLQVLTHCGVYPRTEAGLDGFLRFIASIG